MCVSSPPPPHMRPSQSLTPEPGFVFMEVVVGFVINKVTVKQVFLGSLKFSVPHTHFLYIYHLRHVILANDSVIKQNLLSYLRVTNAYSMLCHFHPFLFDHYINSWEKYITQVSPSFCYCVRVTKEIVVI
jgi:hypothetical protein